MITYKPRWFHRLAASWLCCGITPLHRLAASWLCCGVAAALVTLSSCQNTVDDYFPQPATQRLQTAIDSVRTILRSADNGWELEYYPATDLRYGGIIYTVKFDSLTATVGCSLIADSTETTFYRMTNDNGPVLTFDTYNHLLHYFSTPSGDEYEAKGGEFEFVVDSIGHDAIRLYGKKTRNTMYLRRLNTSHADYATKTINIYDNFVRTFTGNIGGTEVTASCDLGSKLISFSTGSDSIAAHFTFTNSGIRLYRPLNIAGTTLKNLNFNTETLLLSGIGTASTVQLQGDAMPDDMMAFKDYEGNYMLRYDGNTKSANCRLVPNRLDGTYTLEGLSPRWSLTLKYNSETGNLTLGPQVIGDIEGRSVYFATYSISEGGIWIGENCSFTISWNRNRFYPSYNFQPTDPDRYPVDSALLILLYYDEDSNINAELVADRTWLLGSSALISNLNSLVKLRN